MSVETAALWRRPAAIAVVLSVLGAIGTEASRGRPSPALALTGQTHGYLEPCNCGGQRAGGLARRAAMIADLRHEHPDLVLIDIGELLDLDTPGNDPRRLAVIGRTMAYLGVDVCALGNRDLARVEPILNTLDRAAVPATVLGGPAPATRLVESGGQRVGVVSATFGPAALGALVEQVREGLAELREQGAGLLVLVSHLGRPATQQILAALPADLRPHLIALATSDDMVAPPSVSGGVTWVPVARRGRSLSLVRATVTDDGWQLDATTELVADGPVDETVKGWVDEHFRQVRENEQRGTGGGEVRYPSPERCAPCHEPSVRAWREHPHAHAVETLVKLERDIASCLRCHSERMRRDGLRPIDGDGVVCASCHLDLNAHLIDATARPATIDRTGCQSCHTPENSPRWEAERYWAGVVAVCGGDAARP